MKKILLSSAFLAFVFIGYSQFGGTYPNCTTPPGFIFSQGASIGPYDNPTLNGCGNSDDDCGIITPTVGGNNPSNIVFPPQPYSATGYTTCFDIYVFDANLKCPGKQFPCPTYVTSYIVLSTYDRTSAPDESEHFGVGTTELVNPGNNCSYVGFDEAPDPTQQYRVFLDFTNELTCNQSNTRYVLDNLTSVVALPVKFKSINATRTRQNVSVTWETASEANNKGFNVQRNGGGSWETLGFVNSKATGGNSSGTLSYSFNDVNTSKGVTQYRIQQVDIDGKSAYSDIRAVRGEGLNGRLIIYPNPSSDGKVNLVFEDGGVVRDVLIRDISGRLIQQFKAVTNNNIVLENLLNGVYSIQVTDRATSQSVFEKVIIKRR